VHFQVVTVHALVLVRFLGHDLFVVLVCILLGLLLLLGQHGFVQGFFQMNAVAVLPFVPAAVETDEVDLELVYLPGLVEPLLHETGRFGFVRGALLEGDHELSVELLGLHLVLELVLLGTLPEGLVVVWSGVGRVFGGVRTVHSEFGIDCWVVHLEF